MQEMLVELYSHRVIRSRFNYDSFLDILLENRVPYTKKMIPKQTVLIKEKEVDPFVYFIESGVVSLEREEQVISFLGTKEIAGLSNTFIIEESLYTFRTLERCQVYAFHRSALVELLLSMQEGWIYLYMNHMNHDSFLVEQCLVMREPSEIRLKHCLTGLLDKYSVFEDGKVLLAKCFTKKIISNYANVSTKTMTQTWKLWSDEGYIDGEANQFIFHSVDFLRE
ncbi:Crp/Fnr family transcriptional regulator [Listeria newyorkensis]|uniref:Crp/Fnr family transcriptional regulator n=1 Tax=Listeria newyorkensis TaxID=1497681 RepID=A0A841Z2U9_9LIST|nr:Crp/Fnr family transcriptional regulator [Listeria newyorkensis]MBC1459153.1 Crp/Fnr family transcriptional regulator [Listeria newyorkensis]